MIRRVLVPLDGSKIAEERVQEIIRLVKIPGKELDIWVCNG